MLNYENVHVVLMIYHTAEVSGWGRLDFGQLISLAIMFMDAIILLKRNS